MGKGGGGASGRSEIGGGWEGGGDCVTTGRYEA